LVNLKSKIQNLKSSAKRISMYFCWKFKKNIVGAYCNTPLQSKKGAQKNYFSVRYVWLLLIIFIATFSASSVTTFAAAKKPCQEWYEDGNEQGICVELIAPFEDKSKCEPCDDVENTKEKEECEKRKKECELGIVTGKSSDDFIQNYVGKIYRFAAYLVGGVSVMMIIIGGLQIALGGGFQEQQTQGKDRITAALTGLVLFFIAGLILYTINPNFFNMGE